ncbi:MAG: PrgI family protein [Ancrocorticia sp.]
MAFEAKVYKDVRRYQAKVIWGMSWRQFFLALVGLPALIGVYLAFSFNGHADLGSYVVFVLAMPLGAFGFARPLGVPFERYAKHVVSHFLGTRQFTFDESQGEGVNDEHDDSAEARHASRQVEAVNAFEVTN